MKGMESYGSDKEEIITVIVLCSVFFCKVFDLCNKNAAFPLRMFCR